jgi:hypothetical protein
MAKTTIFDPNADPTSSTGCKPGFSLVDDGEGNYICQQSVASSWDTGDTGFAGGVDPNFTGPTKAELNNPTKKYMYTTKDWQILLGMTKADVISVQQQLMKAYPGFKPRALGDRTDPKTITYFKYALGRINQEPTIQGQDVMTALPWMIANPLPISSSGTGLPAFKLTNPIDLKTIFNKTAPSVVGRQLDDADLNKLVSAYQKVELDYQKGKAAKAGTVVMAPDASAFAAKKILEQNPAEASATSHADYIGALSKMMGA